MLFGVLWRSPYGVLVNGHQTLFYTFVFLRRFFLFGYLFFSLDLLHLKRTGIGLKRCLKEKKSDWLGC
jgi:hypothetical protein